MNHPEITELLKTLEKRIHERIQSETGIYSDGRCQQSKKMVSDVIQKIQGEATQKATHDKQLYKILTNIGSAPDNESKIEALQKTITILWGYLPLENKIIALKELQPITITANK